MKSGSLATAENLLAAGGARLEKLLDRDGGGEIGELGRLGGRHPRPETQSQRAGHRVPRPDRVELLEQLDARHLVNALAIRREHPARAAGQEHGLIELAVEVLCVSSAHPRSTASRRGRPARR